MAIFRRLFERQFFGVLAIGIGRTGEETAKLSPLFDHRAAALFADLVGRNFLGLEILHIFRGFLEVLFEFLIKLVQGLDPGHLSIFDFVQLLFHTGGVLDIEDIFEMFDQQVRHNGAQLGRFELALVFCDVLALLNRRPNGCVRGRAPNAFVLKDLHQRCLGVSRGRLGEMLPGCDIDEA